MTEYQPPLDGKFSRILVPTVDTRRFSWLLGQMVSNKWPAMFVGESGTAKSVIIQSYLNSLPVDNYVKLNINFSSRTTSSDLQKTLEDNIDKKSGRNFGPKIPGKKLVVFIDDIHMPIVDIYGTQQPIALLKLLLDKGYMYERGGNLEMKIVKDTQFVSAMLPPGGGTNNVDPRFLSLFVTFSIIFPSYENQERIYNSILKAHLTMFPEELQLLGPKITTATLKLYETISAKLPRTPMKFHYIFNLRDLSRIYEGLLRSTIDSFDTAEKFVRLWRNECLRVFVDKLVTEEDRKLISDETIPELLKEFFPADLQEAVLKDPILIGDYMQANPAEPEAIDPKIYQDCGGYEQVEAKIKGILNDYNDNDLNKEMNLVLFKDALQHITKIHRILRFPRGHALLVGFGGSGKQSLTRLAAYCASYDIFTITLARGYKEKDFREDLKKLYELLTTKETVFLFTDSHVLEEGFLELINNMLTIGMVPALFDEDGKKQMTERIRDEAKKKGIPETKDDLWNYFLEKVRDNLHIVLAMSPAGNVLRIRCRNFPGLVSNTCIDWFFPWPEEALMSVAKFYLEDEDLPEEYRGQITDHIVMVHSSVQLFSKEFELQLKRKNYSTPKNYLDFLNNYKKFLGINRKKYSDMILRYANGCKTLEKAAADVEVLQAQLEVKQKEVNKEKAEVEAIIEDIQQKTEIASKHQTAAVEKKAQLDIDNLEIERKQKEADKILNDAIPILQNAEKALDNIDPSDLVFLKSLPSPKEPIKVVGTMLLILKPNGTEDEKDGWAGVKIMMSVPSAFVVTLKGFGNQISRITQRQIDRIRNQEKNLVGIDLLALSSACNGLYNWIQAMCEFYEVNKKVNPLKARVEELSKKLQALRDELKETEELLSKLNKDLKELQENQLKKQATLNELTEEANIMERRLTAAKKLISGLGREQKRWTDDQALFDEKKFKLLGDCLLSSSFLSYVGPFDFNFRKKMIYETWYQDLEKRGLPYSSGFRLEELLTSDVEISQWASEGLPSDELSVQNGILTTKSSRWPLCIDPQLQAVQWIKKKEEKILTILNLNDGATVYLKMLENSIKFGKTVLFENVDVELDPTIDPVLEKNFVIKGAGVKYLRLGDNDIEFNEDFKLFLTTKLANPQYTPEIMGKTMVINYTVTLQGLWDQLLNVVVGFEKPEKEKQRLQLIFEMSENKKKLKEAEDELLKKLAENTGSLLDNEPLINTLEETKKKSIEITEAIEVGAITQKEIDIARQSYNPVAKRGAILFFAMVGLSAISEMYQYSLSSYLTVFNNSLRDAKKDSILENRLRYIIDRLTINVYDYTCLGIFEVHKLMFAFQMTIMILDGDKNLNTAELDFFFKGNTSLEAISKPKPYKWLTDQGWKDLHKLVVIGDEYKHLVEDLENNEEVFKKWYDLEKPEQEDLPNYHKLTSFQMLLLLKVFRTDRVINGVKKFIIEHYTNNHFVQAPTISYEKIFKQSNEKSPIVFILSPGADPLSDVQKLADQMNFTGTKFKYQSLGQGMEQEATQFVESSASRGHWLMLMNCHLLTSWLKGKLEKMLETLEKPHRDFRLWLTTQPTDKFPLGILQKSLKVIN